MVANKNYKYPDQELYNWVLNELRKRNINEQTIGEIAYEMQHQYLPDLTIEDYGRELREVLKKREVLNILATGFALDNLATNGLLPEPLQSIITEDAGVYGLDESLALALSQLYGSIAVTNYGYTDKTKSGVARELDNSHGRVNTFADDLALALASAVIGRCGHGSKLDLEEPVEDVSDEYRTNVYNEDDFIRFLNTAISNGLEDAIEEVIDHYYYVDMWVVTDEEDMPDSLYIELSDNALNVEHYIPIPVVRMHEYIVKHSEEDIDYGINDLAELIRDYLVDKGYDHLKPSDKESKSDINVEIENTTSVEDSIKKIAEELASVTRQVQGKQKEDPDDLYYSDVFKAFFGDAMRKGDEVNE